MNNKPTDLDHRRDPASQRRTDLRRLTAQVETERAALQQKHEALERNLQMRPANS